MARLTRKNIKVFAENASNNGVFGSLQANNPTTTTDVEQIQSLSAWKDGWNSATQTSEKLPPLEEFQGIQYVVTYEQAYLMQEGLPEWTSNVTYYKGSLTKKVTATGFQLYSSLTDNNIGNALADTENWKLVMDSDNVYALDNSVVHKSGTETITGAKTISGNYLTFKEGGVYSSNPAENQYYGSILFRDASTNQEWGRIRSESNISGDVGVGLMAVNPNNTEQSAIMRVRFNADGTSCAQAPASDINGSVVTTVDKSKSSNGYFKFGNGMIVQWGRSNVKGRTWTSIDLNIDFSNTNYKVFIQDTGTESSDVSYFKVATPRTVSQFRVYSAFSATQDGFDWFAIGY